MLGTLARGTDLLTFAKCPTVHIPRPNPSKPTFFGSHLLTDIINFFPELNCKRSLSRARRDGGDLTASFCLSRATIKEHQAALLCYRQAPPRMLCCWLCCPSPENASGDEEEGRSKQEHLLPEHAAAAAAAAVQDDDADFEHLQHLAMKRDIKVTIQKGTQAGIVAGLSVMTGVIVAGPVGAVAGGAVGTAMAAHMARNVVPLQTLLQQTPPAKRHEVLQMFRESFREEFTETIQGSPELKLLLGGMTVLAVMRYAVDRNLLQNEQLERMDGILRKVY